MAGVKGRTGTNGKGKTANKRDETQKAIDRAEMVKMLRRGLSKGMIAERLGISIGQISYDWKIVLKEMAQTQTRNLKVLTARMEEEVREVMKEAWRGWDKSWEDMEKETTKEGQGPMGAKSEVATTKESRLPGAQFLQIILNCISQIRELRGIALTQIEVIGSHTLDFDLILKEVEGASRGSVEAKLQEMLPPYLEHKVINPQSPSAGTNGELKNGSNGSYAGSDSG